MDKVKILFIAANPEETSKLNLDEEMRSISQRIRSSDHRDSLELISIWAARPDDLLQYLNEHQPHIIHFSGHGNESGEIILLDDNRKPKPVSSTALNALFSVLKNNIKLVILNSCYSKSVADAIVNTVGCVIGMNNPIGDSAAIIYAASFYRAVGFGRSLEDAFEQGKTALLLEGIQEEKTPELVVKNELDPKKIFLVTENNEQNEIAEKWLSETQSYFNDEKYEVAARCAEKFVEWSKKVGDIEMERKAHIRVAISLDNYIITERPESAKHNQVIESIRHHIDAANKLGEPSNRVSLLRAQLARLEHKPQDVIRFAQEAEQSSEAPNDKAEALVAQMQAYWQMRQPENVFESEEKIKILIQELESVDSKLILHGTLLRSLCQAGKATEENVREFVNAVQEEEQKQEDFQAKRILGLVGEVASDFSRANDLENCLGLLILAADLCNGLGDPGRAIQVNLQISEIQAELGNAQEATVFLEKADVWLDKLRTQLQGQTKEKWANMKVASLFTHGRVFKRLSEGKRSSKEKPEQFLMLADSALSEALNFISENAENVTGDVTQFSMEILWWRGRNNVELGRFVEAAADFKNSRPGAIPPVHPLKSRWLKARQLEAEALMLCGQTADALSATENILNSTFSDKESQNRAQALHNYLKDRIIPVSDWLSGDEANEISTKVSLYGLRSVIAEQSKPLVGWWIEFQSNDGKQANSEMFDIWGRGAFSRIIAAVRVQPSNAIIVDATTVESIALWSRLFCPFYDTVIIKWKGPLQDALAMVPMPDYLGPSGTFGGQGYVRTSDVIEKEGYHVAIGWANMIPVDVATFLASEARSLIQSGRLVVLPASLVGCTQTSVGWTDNILCDEYMRGVASVAQKTKSFSRSGDKTDGAIIDIANLSIPFIDNIPLESLNRVLDDTADWLKPMRRMLKSTLGGSDLRNENWESLNPIFEDLRDASIEYKEKLTSLTRTLGSQEWHVSESISSFSTASVDSIRLGSEPITDMLRAIASKKPELGIWIPYWRLQEAGGQVNWSGALDNRSHEPDQGVKGSLAMSGAESQSPQSWFYPGSGGPGMATGFKL